MQLDITKVAPILAAALLSTAVQAQAPASGAQLPALTGDNLNSRTMRLPRDLPADPALLFIAFDQEQQSQIDSWTKGLNDSSAVPWLEVPVIEPANAFVRAMIAGGMRRDITATEARERVLTVYTAPDPVARAVGCIDYRKQLCVAVVEKSGHVRLVLTGAYSLEAAKRVLENMGPTDKTQVPAP
jgi:hypothetical protein